MNITTKYIIFNSAPNLKQCKESESINWIEQNSNRWKTVNTIVNLDPPALPDTSTKGRDDEVTIASKVVEEEEEEEEEEINDSWIRNDDYEGDRSRRSSSGSSNNSSRNQSFEQSITFPHASTSRILLRPSSIRQPDQNQSFNSISQSQQTSNSLIDYPPTFNWKYFTLTSLNNLHALYQSYSQYERPKVSLLTVVLEIKLPRNVGQNGMVLAEWILGDSSESRICLNLWNELAEGWCENIQVGDVVHIDEVGLKLEKDKVLKASPNSFKSNLQMCYRIKPMKDSPEEDIKDYQFNEDLFSDYSDETKHIIHLVHWYKQFYLKS